MSEAAGPDGDSGLQARYDQLWASAIGRIRTGAIEIDPVLAQRGPDARRSLTLLLRPSQPVRGRIVPFSRNCASWNRSSTSITQTNCM